MAALPGYREAMEMIAPKTASAPAPPRANHEVVPSVLHRKRIFQHPRRVLQRSWHHMRVGVHRETDLRVAEGLHHHAWRDAVGDQYGGEAMAQTVHPLLRQAHGFEQRAETVVEIGRLKGRAHAAGEDEIHVPPSGACRTPLLQLPDALCLKRG